MSWMNKGLGTPANPGLRLRLIMMTVFALSIIRYVFYFHCGEAFFREYFESKNVSDMRSVEK
ncbi:hypothetical protein LEP1GSC051_0493 [Leptospira sp. P2653]|nr:hypothetical protein LEP1GSC051_0493 [Leptospira sp. P2653]